MNKKKKILSLLEKHHSLVDLINKHFVKCLIHHRSMAIKHLKDKEDLINQVYKNCLIMILLMKNSKSAKEKILFMLESPLKNKWTTFLDKLNISNDLNMLTIYLFRTL